MTKHLYQLLLTLTLCAASACNQSSREEAQEQFRRRQQAVPEREQPATAPAGTATGEPAAAERTPSKPTTTAGDKVVGVKDGDTIELLQNGKTVTVRLFGVDTPEKTQAYGQRARQFTSDQAFGRNVRLIVNNTDRYGRTVGTIILPDGRSLNEELVRNGYAWHYKAYSNDLKLANLESDARRYKGGCGRRQTRWLHGTSGKLSAAGAVLQPRLLLQRLCRQGPPNAKFIYATAPLPVSITSPETAMCSSAANRKCLL